jgi:NADH dehydrogenase FAD-containing subunit
MSIADAAHDPARSRVLIAGGGVAGLETLLALRALASDLLDIRSSRPSSNSSTSR